MMRPFSKTSILRFRRRHLAWAVVIVFAVVVIWLLLVAFGRLKLPAASLFYPIAQTVLTLILGFMGLEMANNPPQQEEHKVRWRVTFLVISSFLVIVAWCQAKYQSDKDTEGSRTLNSLSGQVEKLRREQSEGYRSICTVFSTNAAIDPIIRLSVLKTEQAKITEEGISLKEVREVTKPGIVNLDMARKEREVKLAIQENQKRKALVDGQIAAVEAERTQKESQRISEQNQRIQEQNRRLEEQKQEETNRRIAVKILPIFDYAIRALDKALEDIAFSCGEKRLSDFPGTIPTAYGSSLVRDNMIVNGTNFICVGSNSAWRFRISSALISPNTMQRGRPVYMLDKQSRFPRNTRPFASLNIISETTNGQSALEITPIISLGSITNIGVPSVSIKLTVPSGLNIDQKMILFTNYPTSVERAIRGLIGEQDQQAPLVQKAH